MTNPYWFLDVRQITCAIQDVFVAVTRQPAMLLTVNVLDVEQYQVGALHQSLEFQEERLFTGKGLCSSVQTSVDASAVRLLKQVNQKVNLQQCLASANGDAAFRSPVAAISLCLVEEFIDGGGFSGIATFPGIRVVAVSAAHVAALQENKEPNPWPVNGAEGFG